MSPEERAQLEVLTFFYRVDGAVEIDPAESAHYPKIGVGDDCPSLSEMTNKDDQFIAQSLDNCCTVYGRPMAIPVSELSRVCFEVMSIFGAKKLNWRFKIATLIFGACPSNKYLLDFAWKKLIDPLYQPSFDFSLLMLKLERKVGTGLKNGRRYVWPLPAMYEELTTKPLIQQKHRTNEGCRYKSVSSFDMSGLKFMHLHIFQKLYN